MDIDGGVFSSFFFIRRENPSRTFLLLLLCVWVFVVGVEPMKFRPPVILVGASECDSVPSEKGIKIPSITISRVG